MRKDFALCLNDDYVPYACVVIKSIVAHIKQDDDVHIHLLSDYISDEHKRFIDKVSLGVTVHIYYIDNSLYFRRLPKEAFSWSLYAWYRILLPTVLDDMIRRVLYLDCDVLVNDPLDDLFTMNMDGKSIAACVDIETHTQSLYDRLGYDSKLQYICSGVILMNLEKWRTDNLFEQIMDFAINNPQKLQCPDQDAINYICRVDKIILSPKYGVMVPYFRYEWFMKEHLDEMEEMMNNPAIIHYAIYQPWVYHRDKSMHSVLWWKTFNSLYAFPYIRYAYLKTLIKYCLKVLLIKFGVIRKGSRHYICDMYYYHPRIKKKDILVSLDKIRKDEGLM